MVNNNNNNNSNNDDKNNDNGKTYNTCVQWLVTYIEDKVLLFRKDK